jgi:ubiquinone/menaquinone biosynthesis C-methylase UbiE
MSFAASDPGSTTEFLKLHFAGIRAGRILDAATGDGEFLGELVGIVGGYDDAIGVDLDDERLAKAREEFTDSRMRFERMDATALTFEDASFDMVSVRNALHHCNEPEKLLRELMRVLKPGGLYVIVERIQEQSNQQQQLNHDMHHWWSAVHRAMGKVHNETFREADLRAMIGTLGLQSTSFAVVTENKRDPRDPERLEAFHRMMDEHLAELEALGGQDELIATGRELRKKIPEIGVANAAQLAMVGWK